MAYMWIGAFPLSVAWKKLVMSRLVWRQPVRCEVEIRSFFLEVRVFLSFTWSGLVTNSDTLSGLWQRCDSSGIVSDSYKVACIHMVRRLVYRDEFVLL